jgi:putative ABC transport system permease protein
MGGLVQDLRYALRQLRKSPGFALSAIVVLALGIGATTGMLAIVQSVLLRSLQYRAPDRLMLVDVSGDGDEGDWFVVPIAEFPDMQRDLHQFQQLAAFNSLPVPVETDESTQMLLAPEVSVNFFQTLGVLPAIGRPFREGDDAPGAGAAIISHEFWHNSMHGSRDVLGRKLKINGDLYTVVGVMPPRFQFPVTYGKSIWTALQLTPDHKTRQGLGNFQVLGRLRPGVTAGQARSEGEAFVRNRKPTSASAPPVHFGVYPYQQTITGESRPGLLALLGACLVLLLIAIVNTTNLQIARATTRQGEIAMRSVLGASRGRIVRQMIVESLLLSSAGAALGWFVATTFVSVARRLFPHQPRFDSLQFDPWTLAGCLLISVVCGVAAAIAPSWHVLKSRQGLLDQATVGGRISRQSQLSKLLVAAEVALSTVLLVAAGLFLRTLRSLENVPLGFNAENVTTFLLWAQGGNTMPMTLKVAAYQRVLDRLEQLPNVDVAGMVTSLPVSNFQMTSGSGFRIPGFLSLDAKPSPFVLVTAVSPGYYQALRIPIIAGRALSASDTASTQPVGVVNQAFTEKYLRSANGIGQQIVLEKATGILQPITIVGVTGNVIQRNSIGEPSEPELALSYLQLPASAQFSQYMIGFSDGFAVRTHAAAADIGGTIRAIVKSEAPDFAIDDLVPFRQAVESEMKTQRLTLQITSAFAWIAVLLSGAGLYAVLAYVVGQRIHEMGIRVALGATRGNVFGLIVRQGMWMAGAGLVCGWAVALVAGRWIRSFLFGVTIADPITYGTAGILIVLASAVAVLVPAHRAARVEPMVALRYE